MIYICYGITKSASTFLYQLVEEVFRVGHRKAARLGPPFRPHLSVENYIDVIDPVVLRDVAAQLGNRDVVLKTHGRLHPEVAERIEAGELHACASIRDPRELALSLIDHGRRARRRGNAPFSECHDIDDTFASLDEQIESFSAWSALPRVQVFTYNEICFDSAVVVDRIAAQIGVVIRSAEVLAPFRNNRGIGQFNKGAALRYWEMTPEKQAIFLERYAALYKKFAFDTQAAASAETCQRQHEIRVRGQVSRSLVYIRRRLRG